jgi:glycosyltransferase involved in cell wall biosynthesis
MPAVLSRAAVYLSTGSREYEGAPNVFLQAGASGVPILSLEVSTELLEETPCGTTAGGDLHRLAESLKEYWNDPAARHKAGQMGRNYVEQHCELKHLVAELAHELTDLMPAPIDPDTAGH